MAEVEQEDVSVAPQGTVRGGITQSQPQGMVGGPSTQMAPQGMVGGGMAPVVTRGTVQQARPFPTMPPGYHSARASGHYDNDRTEAHRQGVSQAGTPNFRDGPIFWQNSVQYRVGRDCCDLRRKHGQAQAFCKGHRLDSGRFCENPAGCQEIGYVSCLSVYGLSCADLVFSLKAHSFCTDCGFLLCASCWAYGDLAGRLAHASARRLARTARRAAQRGHA